MMKIRNHHESGEEMRESRYEGNLLDPLLFSGHWQVKWYAKEFGKGGGRGRATTEEASVSWAEAQLDCRCFSKCTGGQNAG
jgi:hypothetical protein